MPYLIEFEVPDRIWPILDAAAKKVGVEVPAMARHALLYSAQGIVSCPICGLTVGHEVACDIGFISLASLYGGVYHAEDGESFLRVGPDSSEELEGDEPEAEVEHIEDEVFEYSQTERLMEAAREKRNGAILARHQKIADIRACPFCRSPKGKLCINAASYAKGIDEYALVPHPERGGINDPSPKEGRRQPLEKR